MDIVKFHIFDVRFYFRNKLVAFIFNHNHINTAPSSHMSCENSRMFISGALDVSQIPCYKAHDKRNNVFLTLSAKKFC